MDNKWPNLEPRPTLVLQPLRGQFTLAEADMVPRLRPSNAVFGLNGPVPQTADAKGVTICAAPSGLYDLVSSTQGVALGWLVLHLWCS